MLPHAATSIEELVSSALKVVVPQFTLALAICRNSRRPVYLNDYHCYYLTTCKYPIENHVSSENLSQLYAEFVIAVSSHYEPSFYHQVCQYPERHSTMDAELHALEEQLTWTLMPLLVGKQTIACKWVFQVKLFAY